jgi:hypothetical protein
MLGYDPASNYDQGHPTRVAARPTEESTALHTIGADDKRGGAGERSALASAGGHGHDMGTNTDKEEEGYG